MTTFYDLFKLVSKDVRLGIIQQVLPHCNTFVVISNHMKFQYSNETKSFIPITQWYDKNQRTKLNVLYCKKSESLYIITKGFNKFKRCIQNNNDINKHQYSVKNDIILYSIENIQKVFNIKFICLVCYNKCIHELNSINESTLLFKDKNNNLHGLSIYDAKNFTLANYIDDYPWHIEYHSILYVRHYLFIFSKSNTTYYTNGNLLIVDTDENKMGFSKINMIDHRDTIYVFNSNVYTKNLVICGLFHSIVNKNNNKLLYNELPIDILNFIGIYFQRFEEIHFIWHHIQFKASVDNILSSISWITI